MSLISPSYLVDIAGANYAGAEEYEAILLLSSYTTDPTDETVSDLVASAAAGAGRVLLSSKTVTNEPISGWLVDQADHAISDTTVTIDTGTGTPLPGDTFTLGASTQILEVVSYAANVITYTPAATAAAADNAAVNFRISGHVLFDCANLQFTDVTESTVGPVAIYQKPAASSDSTRPLMAIITGNTIVVGASTTLTIDVTIPPGGFHSISY